jgi:uncharacterized protein YecT (DUF1311 family)
LDAGRRRKKIAGGGGPGEESSSQQQSLVEGTSDTKNQEPTRQQTYDKEGNEAYNNAYEAIEDRYRQKEITFKEFTEALDALKDALKENTSKGWTRSI